MPNSSHNMPYEVQIIAYNGEDVIESIPCASLHIAEKVERGVQINLDHDEYFTHIVQPKEASGE